LKARGDAGPEEEGAEEEEDEEAVAAGAAPVDVCALDKGDERGAEDDEVEPVDAVTAFGAPPAAVGEEEGEEEGEDSGEEEGELFGAAAVAAPGEAAKEPVDDAAVPDGPFGLSLAANAARPAAMELEVGVADAADPWRVVPENLCSFMLVTSRMRTSPDPHDSTPVSQFSLTSLALGKPYLECLTSLVPWELCKKKAAESSAT
jgi:hypothetical protein